ncbi:MAG TPA: NAD(P)-dependent oxidoreductase [Phycisphaeraceae bacterium]
MSHDTPTADRDAPHPSQKSQTIRRVGYIGLGIMGRAMAMNLLRAGFELTVWNRTASRCEPLAQQGAQVADSPMDLAARGPDVICINVTDTPDVEEVIFGPQGIARGAKPGLIVVDHSTISPQAARDFAHRLAQQGVTLLDAPVTGGDRGAQAGTLSIMVGGPAEAFERLRPLFQAVGQNIVHLGESGLGQLCKACNQIAVACNLLGACEALALAQKGGLDLQKMIQVVAHGAGGSWQLANLGPKIAQGDYAPGFMVDLALKDLAIVADAARQHRLPLSGTALAESYLRAASASGSGRLGTQAMAQTLEQLGAFRYSKR